MTSPLPTTALRPDPDQARAWLERELARPAYHESLAQRLVSWLGDLWQSLQAAASGASALSSAAAVGLVVVLAVAVALAVGRVRREPLGRTGAGAALGAGAVPAETHRVAAEAALAAGDHAQAIVEGFRAVAARAVHRGVLDERPGRTAHELATELAPLFPDHARALADASAIFDLVFYGHQPAQEPDARSVLALDDELRIARPVRSATASPVAAGPVGR